VRYRLGKIYLLSAILVVFTLPCHGAFLTAEVAYSGGRVEIIRSEGNKREMLSQYHKCGQNDKIITHSKSVVVLLYKDGTKLYLGENSKVLINSSETTEFGNANKLLTLYHGTAFLSLYKSLENYEGHHGCIYTPVFSAVSKEGGMFTKVDKAGINAEAYVIAGTLHVRGLSRDESYLKEGTFITGDSIGKLSQVKEFDEDEFILDHSWLGSKFLTKEFDRGQLMRKRKMDVIAGKTQGKVIVMKLEFKNNKFSWDVGSFISLMAAEQFQKVSYREVAYHGQDEEDPITYSQQHGADRLIMGKIKSFDISKKSVLSSDSTKYVLLWKVSLWLDMRVYDPGQNSVIKNELIRIEKVAQFTLENDIRWFYQYSPEDKRSLANQKFIAGIFEDLEAGLYKFGKSAL
jgi:hypothetical protein